MKSNPILNRRFAALLFVGSLASLPALGEPNAPMSMGMGHRCMDHHPGGHGPGMGAIGQGGGMGSAGVGPGTIGRMFMGLLRLDLTEDQRAKIEKIHDELHRKQWDTKGKIMEEKTKLRDLLREDTLDAKKIAAAQEQIFKLRRGSTDAHIEAFNKAAGLLTKEQRETLRKRRVQMTADVPMHSGPHMPAVQ